MLKKLFFQKKPDESFESGNKTQSRVPKTVRGLLVFLLLHKINKNAWRVSNLYISGCQNCVTVVKTKF